MKERAHHVPHLADGQVRGRVRAARGRARAGGGRIHALLLVRPTRSGLIRLQQEKAKSARVERDQTLSGHRGTARLDPRRRDCLHSQVDRRARPPSSATRALTSAAYSTARRPDGRIAARVCRQSSSRGRPSRLAGNGTYFSPRSISDASDRDATSSTSPPRELRRRRRRRRAFVSADAFAELIAANGSGARATPTPLTRTAGSVASPERRGDACGAAVPAARSGLCDQVEEALTSTSGSGSAIGRTSGGNEGPQRLGDGSPIGWKVFVEQPESAAFAAVRGTIWRTLC